MMLLLYCSKRYIFMMFILAVEYKSIRKCLYISIRYYTIHVLSGVMSIQLLILSQYIRNKSLYVRYTVTYTCSIDDVIFWTFQLRMRTNMEIYVRKTFVMYPQRQWDRTLRFNEFETSGPRPGIMHSYNHLLIFFLVIIHRFSKIGVKIRLVSETPQ
jgi:hypothetical protein